jgi:hypothetical protein
MRLVDHPAVFDRFRLAEGGVGEDPVDIDAVPRLGCQDRPG